MGISFLPGRISSLTLLVLMSSILTNYVSVHVCTGAGKHMCGGTMKKFTPGKYNCFINLVPIHCKNVRVIITLVWSSQLHLFRGFYYTRMITVYKPHIEILIATFCFQNWWSRTAKALQSWETPNRCNSDNHSNFKMTLTFLQCSGRYYIKAAKKGQETSK